MRIAVASWTARRVGGVEEYISILLPALADAGVELAFWHEVDEPVSRAIIPLPAGTLSICEEAVGRGAAIAQLRAWKPDVIYCQGLREPAAEARLLQVSPVVMFVHTYVGTCVSGTKMFSRPVARPCSRRFGWPCLAHYFPHGCGGLNPATMWRLFGVQSQRLDLLGRSRTVLTHTEHMRVELARHGVSSTRIPYAVRAEAPCRRPGVSETWRLLFAGRMERPKGGDYLLDALPEIAAMSARPVRATFAGDGTERAAWELKARRLERMAPGLTIDFTGWLSPEGVGGLMDESDLLVVPSVWPEPFGAIGPAAGQHGLPAAGFAVGGISEWLHDGVTGHLAPGDPPSPSGLAAAVARCLEHPDHHVRLRAGALEMGARFTIVSHLRALMTYLKAA